MSQAVWSDADRGDFSCYTTVVCQHLQFEFIHEIHHGFFFNCLLLQLMLRILCETFMSHHLSYGSYTLSFFLNMTKRCSLSCS